MKTWPKNTISVVAWLSAGGALAALALRHHLFATHPALLGVQIGAAALMLWARATFGRRSFHAAASPSAGGLVTSGPYRFWRHPIYASILYFVWAGQVESVALSALGWAALATFGLVVRMLLEEHFLRAAYPDYVDYSERAKRFVPFVL